MTSPIQDPLLPPPRLIDAKANEVQFYELLYRLALAYDQDFIRQGLIREGTVAQTNFLTSDDNWIIMWCQPVHPLGLEGIAESLREKAGDDGLFAGVNDVVLEDLASTSQVLSEYYVVVAPNGWCFILLHDRDSNRSMSFIHHLYDWAGRNFLTSVANSITRVLEEEGGNIHRDAPNYTD